MTGMGMFEDDPQDLPGQGLMRADNYNAATANSEYLSLLKGYLSGLAPALEAEQEFGPKYATARNQTLATTLSGNSETAGVSKLYLDALRAADPQAAALLDSLTQSASSELALDNQLDPSQLRMVEQSGRASAAARGMGFGPSDAFAESFKKLGYGEDLRTKRRGNALTLAQLRTSLAARPADVAIGASLSESPSLTNRDQTYGLLNNVYAQNQQNNRTTSQNETEMAGKFVDMMGSLI